MSVVMASFFVKITDPYLAVIACVENMLFRSWWLLNAGSLMGLPDIWIVVRPAWIQRECSDVADVVVMEWVSFFIPGQGLMKSLGYAPESRTSVHLSCWGS